MDKSVFTQEYRVLLQLLREIRQSRGITQEELATRLNETQSWVSKCERGEHRLDLIELRQVCQALEIPIVEFARLLENKLSRFEDNLT